MKILSIILMCLLPFSAADTFGASHWTVNPHLFQYDMTVYSSLKVSPIDGYEIAAFCGEECRGVGKLISATDGTQIIQMRIYSSSVNGETIRFKIYDITTKQEYSCDSTIVFMSDNVVGMPSAPFVIDFKQPFLRGDANGDGEIGMPDVMYIVNYILGTPADDFDIEAADANSDGEVGMPDVMYIVNYILNGKYPDK